MSEPHWNVVVVEDDATIRTQVKDFLEGETLAGRVLAVSAYPDFDSAQQLLNERKADVVILDLFLGAPAADHADGLKVLEAVKATGFVPFVIYTAKPEAVTDQLSPFVRLVGKADGGLDRLWSEIEGLFNLRIPQIHRGIAEHLDRSLAEYLWKFVVPNWDELEPLADKPEFVRLLLQRLAASLTQSGLDKLTTDIFGSGTSVELAGPDKVHPAEMYIKPGIGRDPLLGDIRVRQRDEQLGYLVVLSPSCDMVSMRDGGPAKPKATHALCARAERVRDLPEYAEWRSSRSNNAKERVQKRLKGERVFHLPAAWDIPDLLVDFQALEYLALEDVKGLSCLATIESPYAEALGSRFLRHLGRIGVPDIDPEIVSARLFS